MHTHPPAAAALRHAATQRHDPAYSCHHPDRSQTPRHTQLLVCSGVPAVSAAAARGIASWWWPCARVRSGSRARPRPCGRRCSESCYERSPMLASSSSSITSTRRLGKLLLTSPPPTSPPLFPPRWCHTKTPVGSSPLPPPFSASLVAHVNVTGRVAVTYRPSPDGAATTAQTMRRKMG
jgi:hypothetical protein